MTAKDQRQVLSIGQIDEFRNLLSVTQIPVPFSDDWDHQIDGAHEFARAIESCVLAALQSPQPAVPVVSDEQILEAARKWSNSNFVAGSERFLLDFARAILALRPADHPDTQRCIKARNDLNAALHGGGALIDDLEHAVANACAKLRRPAVEPMTNEQRDYVRVPISLIRRAQNAINWHLEPNSPDEHEATMLELTAIGWPNDGSGIAAKAEGGA